MNNLAIIPARGGSKRIPRKNIKPFLGKPIMAYSIEAAHESGLFEEVMVSTDDEEIATVAIAYGATVPFMRSPQNANDFATTADVLLEVLGAYGKTGRQFRYACCIYPTAPFVHAGLLSTAFQQLSEGNFDSVFPVMPFGFPIQRAVRLAQNGKVEMFYPQFQETRSQDLEPAYHDCGQFYWFDPAALLSKKKLWTDNTAAVILSEMDAHDIDTEEDWRVAEVKYGARNGKVTN